MLRTRVPSHASPSETEQSCSSWHRSGVTNAKRGSVPAARSPCRAPLESVPRGTSFAPQVLSCEKYVAGLCRTE